MKDILLYELDGGIMINLMNINSIHKYANEPKIVFRLQGNNSYPPAKTFDSLEDVAKEWNRLKDLFGEKI